MLLSGTPLSCTVDTGGRMHRTASSGRVLQDAAFEGLPVVAVGEHELLRRRQPQAAGRSEGTHIQPVDRLHHGEERVAVQAGRDRVDRAVA